MYIFFTYKITIISDRSNHTFILDWDSNDYNHHQFIHNEI